MRGRLWVIASIKTELVINVGDGSASVPVCAYARMGACMRGAGCGVPCLLLVCFVLGLYVASGAECAQP
jgi:hypothetical protein